MKYILMLLLAFSVSAFADVDFTKFKKHTLTKSEFEAIEDSLKDKLKDPDSLRFSIKNYKQIKAIKNDIGSITGCVIFNSKNSYGGYGDSSVAIFIVGENTDFGYVTIIDIDVALKYPNCSEAVNKWNEQ